MIHWIYLSPLLNFVVVKCSKKMYTVDISLGYHCIPYVLLFLCLRHLATFAKKSSPSYRTSSLLAGSAGQTVLFLDYQRQTPTSIFCGGFRDGERNHAL